jgi:hypothetical protein
MQPYQYHRLNHPDSIRLVAILPDNLDAVHCNIIHYQSSTTYLYYEALPYTWGDASD